MMNFTRKFKPVNEFRSIWQVNHYSGGRLQISLGGGEVFFKHLELKKNILRKDYILKQIGRVFNYWKTYKNILKLRIINCRSSRVLTKLRVRIFLGTMQSLQKFRMSINRESIILFRQRILKQRYSLVTIQKVAFPSRTMYPSSYHHLTQQCQSGVY